MQLCGNGLAVAYFRPRGSFSANGCPMLIAFLEPQIVSLYGGDIVHLLHNFNNISPVKGAFHEVYLFVSLVPRPPSFLTFCLRSQTRLLLAQACPHNVLHFLVHGRGRPAKNREGLRAFITLVDVGGEGPIFKYMYIHTKLESKFLTGPLPP